MIKSETIRNSLFMGMSLLFFGIALSFVAQNGMEELSLSVEKSTYRVLKESESAEILNLSRLTDALGGAVSGILAEISVKHLLNDDFDAVADIVEAALKFPDIISIIVKKSDGTIVAGESWMGSLDGEGRIKGFRTPILHVNKMIGSVEIVATTAFLDNIRTGNDNSREKLLSSFKSDAEATRISVGEKIITLAATLLFFFLIVNTSIILGFFAPLRRMTSVIKLFSDANLSPNSGPAAPLLGDALSQFKADLEHTVPAGPSDEFSVLSSALISMTDLLRSRMKVQEAITDILNVAATSRTKEDLAWSLLRLLMKETGSCMCAFYIRRDTDPDSMQLVASAGLPSDSPQSIRISMLEGQFGAPILDNEVHLLNIPPASSPALQTIAGGIMPAQILTLPICVRDELAAFITMASLEPYSEEYRTAISIVRKGLNSAMGNLLAGERERTLVQDLQAANQELAAQSEELEYQAHELEAHNVELNIQRSKSEKVSKLKTEFLSNMSHELRTPLNSILALSRVLSTEGKERLTAEEQEYLAIIERNGRNLLSLINGILDLSRIEAGREELRLKEVQIGRLLLETAESVRQLAKDKGIYIECCLEQRVPPVITDEEKLRRMLLNIVGNAMKFTETGGVRLIASAEDSLVRVDIEDTGIGIKESELPFIFDEFRQSDGSTARKYEGTGLGLAIVKKISEVLDIEISVNSRLNEGTSFTLLIKRLPENGVVSDDAQRLSQEVPAAPLIYIIDDNPVEAMQLRHTLEHEGFRVSVFRNGQDSLNALEENTPDGLIFDLYLQDMEGLDFLKEMRSLGYMIPVMLLTTRVLKPADISNLNEHGVRSLALRGEVRPDELVAKVRSMMYGTHARGGVGRT